MNFFWRAILNFANDREKIRKFWKIWIVNKFKRSEYAWKFIVKWFKHCEIIHDVLKLNTYFWFMKKFRCREIISYVLKSNFHVLYITNHRYFVIFIVNLIIFFCFVFDQRFQANSKWDFNCHVFIIFDMNFSHVVMTYVNIKIIQLFQKNRQLLLIQFKKIIFIVW